MSYSFIVGIICLIVGAYMIISYLIVKSKAEPIKGKVIGYQEGRDNRSNTTYNPVVRFERNGETLEMPTELFESKKKFEIDADIDVFFLEGKDYVMRAGGNTSLKQGLILIAGGIVLVLLNLI